MQAPFQVRHSFEVRSESSILDVKRYSCASSLSTFCTSVLSTLAFVIPSTLS